MGRKFKYTSINTIISKIYRDYGLKEISEVDVIEWVGEALSFFDVTNIFKDSVAFIKVKDYKAELPKGYNQIHQVLKINNCEEKEFCPANVLFDSTNLDENSSEISVQNIPCDKYGNPIPPEQLVYKKDYFQIQYDFYYWGKSNLYNKAFENVKLSTDIFFNSDCNNKKNNCNGVNYEYAIVDDILKLNFKEGIVAVAYNSRVTDLDGMPLIPDDASFINAITYFIMYRYFTRLWAMGREGYAQKRQEMEKQWEWYKKQADNKAFIPYGVDEHQNLLEQLRTKSIFKERQYYNSFKNLNKRK